MTVPRSPREARAEATSRFWSWPGFALILAGYFALHLGLRLVLSPTIGVDDATETVFAQSLRWSYWPNQPPLYTWLLWATFQIFGAGVVGLAVLRYAAVAATYLFFYLSARRLLPDPRLALLAGLSPSLIYAVGWQAHVGFTETAVLAAACAASLYAMLRVAGGAGWPAFAGLGIAIGLGLLSKWGFAAFAASLLGAALLQEESRRRLLSPPIAVTLAAAALVAGPYVLWGLETSRTFGSVFASTMKGSEAPYLAGVAAGLGTLAASILAFLAPFWIVALAVFPRTAAEAARPGRTRVGFDGRGLLAHQLLIALAIGLLAVLIAGVTLFKSRWMHPLLILFPLYFFCLVRDAGYEPRRWRWFAGALAAAAVLVILFRIGQDAVGPPFCERCRLLKPYPELAEAVAGRGFTRGTIVAGDEYIAGNFRLRFPESRVGTSNYPFYVPPLRGDVGGQCLVVWDAELGESIPPALAGFLAEGFDASAPPGPPAFVEAPHRGRDPRTLRLAYLLGPGIGRCR